MRSPHERPLVELWAGAECSVVRIADRYVDQSELTGHAGRLDDLDRLASLGAAAVRLPVLWERTAPGEAARADWRDADARLGRLRELGVRPVVGLVHHGSGPSDTSLLDPAWPERLASYARAVAERYPWVHEWSPVNEPLTTARFSCLYGHWYPHARDDESFVRALLNQCRGVVLAMRAIRDAVPDARLIQTDDLGKTHSTARLAYQAAFEIERRWLTWDLLTGRVTRSHALWSWLRAAGADEWELHRFADSPCPPDVVGVNTYLGSERFLDERLGRYPAIDHGGNGRDRYADVVAARVLAAGPDGPASLLREVWRRYRLAIAVTEVHNGCTREEQLRWLDEVWRAAEGVREEGADVQAVTLWSAFGAVGWANLLRDGDDWYEVGAWDATADPPRATALAAMARRLAAGDRYEHPALSTAGWWRRQVRLRHEPHGVRFRPPAPVGGRPVLVTGAAGTLGRAFARACEVRGLPCAATTREQLDAADATSVAGALDELRPWAVVNAAGFVRVDDAEHDEEHCRRANTLIPAVLARACAAHGVPLATFSSDLVFDGTAGRAYVEPDDPAPLSAYGHSKAAAEAAVLDAHDGALVIRTAAFFGPDDDWNFVTVALRAFASGTPFVAPDDLVVSPTYVPALVDAALDLLIDGERGIWHLACREALTWADLARRAADAAGVAPATLDARPAAECGFVAPRPRSVPLASERGRLMPTLDDALSRYVAAATPVSTEAAA